MTLPAWVRKRDGTQEPFDPDKISRALFNAGESLGQADAFLARELADGVVHFLAAESYDKHLTTVQIEESVAKVVRELGHPGLAQAYADRAQPRSRSIPTEQPSGEPAPGRLSISVSPTVSRAEFTDECLRAFSLEQVFSSDLAAAHREGLITLAGLESPFELAGCVLDPILSPWEGVAQARRLAGVFVAIDSPDYAVAEKPGEISKYVKELCLALRTVGLKGIVNLNSGVAPSWASTSVGPLFSESAHAQGQISTGAAAWTLKEVMSNENLSRPVIEIQWHLGERDISLLHEDLNRHILGLPFDMVQITFAFDRPDRPVSLAPAVDRQNPALLLMVQLNLPRLAAQLAGVPDAAALFLKKLGSLVRLALSAGVQKRDFLRKHGTDKEYLARSFLLDRARLLLGPVGLDSVITTLLGCSLADSSAGLDFARRIVERLLDVVSEDARTRHLAVCLDGRYLTGTSLDLSPGQVSNLRDQVRVAAALHAAADLGATNLFVPKDDSWASDELVESLRWLWKRSNVSGVRLSRPDPTPRQLTFGE
jgi:hypothetical protein